MAKQKRTSGMPWWYTGIITIILAGATTVTIVHLWREPQVLRSDYIAHDITRLAEIFSRINETCSIISFDRTHNYIDFLNIIEYKGSEVGPMNLRYPDGWEGPYLRDNPTMQGVAYMVLAAQDGHYVVPGEGVTLSNGKTIGSDILLDADTNVQSLLTADGGLMHKDKQLAAWIPVEG